jgi:triacylglycerol esterase/lipase EstA (alpha/beta hydrolase family)
MNLLLLHGQGRTTNAMRLLGFRLRRHGHAVQYFRYYTRTEKFSEIVTRLVDMIQKKMFMYQSYVVIGHSMGGLLARASLPFLVEHLPKHLILLASPNQPPRLSAKIKNNIIYKYLTSDCGQLALNADFYKTLPKPTIPTTVIAGSGAPRVSWLPYGYEANDGAISVQETDLGVGYQTIQVPSIHTFIMNSRQTLHHIDHILEEYA